MQTVITMIRENHPTFVKLFHSELEQKGGGVLVFVANGESADVAYYPLGSIRSSYILGRLRVLLPEIESGQVVLDGKLVIQMPVHEEEEPATLEPMFYVIQVGQSGRLFELLPQADRSYLMVLDQSEEEKLAKPVAEPVEGTERLLGEKSRRWELVWLVEGGEEYKRVCRMAGADRRIFRRFRSCAEFLAIIGGNNEEEGEQMAKLLERDFPPEGFEDYLILDEVGGPFKYYYAECGWELSPQTLRYLLTAMEIGRKTGGLEGGRVLEIGAGYGGMAGVLRRVFPEIREYVGTEGVFCIELARRYIEEVALPATYTISAEIPGGDWDLAISCRTLSQFEEDVRQTIWEHLLAKCHAVFLEVEESALPWFEQRLPAGAQVEPAPAPLGTHFIYFEP